MKQYLIQFKAEYYCQGYEWGTFQMLVTGETFEEACDKIKRNWSNHYSSETAKDFRNLTIE